MNLIKITRDILYLTIDDGVTINSIKLHLFKSFLYNKQSGSIVAVLHRNTTMSWHYTEVEDNNNPGNPYQSLDDFWEWLITTINSTPSYEVTENGENVTEGGENVTHTTL